MISKGRIYHIVGVMDIGSMVSILDSILIVNEFPNVFPNDLPDFPPKRKIDFSIDIVRVTQLISIPPY